MDVSKSKIIYGDPFAVEPLPKAFYYPSPDRQLSRRQRATALNYTCDVKEPEQDQNYKVSAEDKDFLYGTNSFQLGPITFDSKPALEDDINFDESWPASERPSSISFNGIEDDSQLDLENYQSIVDRFVHVKDTAGEYSVTAHGKNRMPTSSGPSAVTNKSKIPVKGVKPANRTQKVPANVKLTGVTSNKPSEASKDADDGSVLQRYVERFRNSAPMSREDRLKKESDGKSDFWWLSNNVPQSPAESYAAPEQTVASTAMPDTTNQASIQQQSMLTKANVEKYKHLQKLAEKQKHPVGMVDSPDHRRTLELQKRAEMLLEKSLSSVTSTEPAVSTEGLGSNMSDTVMSGLEEYTYKPKFANYLEPELPAQRGLPPPLPGQRALQEDDPLQQWRLRRRIEVAQQSTPHETQSFNFLSKSEQQKKIDYKLEEFKQRLSGKTSANVSRPSQHVHFTPTPSQHQEEPYIYSPRDQDPVPSVQPQIASPTLRRCRPRTDQSPEIDPHLHLMCDLLPCPHRGQLQQSVSDQYTQNDKQGTGYKLKADNYCDKGKFRGDNLPDVKFKGDNFNDYSENEKKVENHRQNQYKQYLEAEKPDIDSQSDPSDSNKESGVETSHKHKHSDLEKMLEDIVISKTEDADSTRSDDSASDHYHSRSKQIHSDNRSSEHIKDKKRSRDSPREASDTNQKLSASRDSKQNQPSASRQTRPSDTHQGQLSKHDHRNTEKTRDNQDDKGVLDAKHDKTTSGGEESGTGKVIKPQHSSSPTLERRGVYSAIGQVIKEHLFSTSTSTVLSSVESLPPSVPHDDKVPNIRKPPQTSPPQPKSQKSDDNKESSSCDSDGEFGEDDLLVMLRKQRAVYEQQLHDIDQKLDSLEGNTR